MSHARAFISRNRTTITTATLLATALFADSYPLDGKTSFAREDVVASVNMPPTSTLSASQHNNFSGSNVSTAAGGRKRTPPHLPTMIVFDLDDCLWHPEMHELPGYPEIPLEGDLDPSNPGKERGVVGMQVPRRRTTVRLYEGARLVLRELATDPKYEGIILACASTSLEPSYSHACLEGLEVLPGLTLRNMFAHDEIGRTGKLTSRKTGHFRLLRQDSGVPYEEMLFFDDCNWGDHCRDVFDTFGVIGQRTPYGMQLSEFHQGLENYRKAVEQRTKGGGEL